MASPAKVTAVVPEPLRCANRPRDPRRGEVITGVLAVVTVLVINGMVQNITW